MTAEVAPEVAPEVVAIGASLGGLTAIQIILGGLPASFRCPIVLTQHRKAEVDGRLVELLNGYSTLPVVEPDDKEPILPGQVYLAPPNYHLIIERGFFSLSLDPPVWFARPSIDVLFESVADSYGPKAIAVMLTGSNQDGAAGAHAVKMAGGYVLVQDPDTARAPTAPRAVLARTVVDEILPLEGIAARLTALCDSYEG
jgi:two-component system, chemotaxis family, protein-glutamate methylesterase/glutaminase